MMPEETVQTNIDLRSTLLMPIHWGAFKLALQPWQELAEFVTKEVSHLGVALAVPKIAEPRVLGAPAPSSHGWDKKA